MHSLTWYHLYVGLADYTIADESEGSQLQSALHGAVVELISSTESLIWWTEPFDQFERWVYLVFNT